MVCYREFGDLLLMISTSYTSTFKEVRVAIVLVFMVLPASMVLKRMQPHYCSSSAMLTASLVLTKNCLVTTANLLNFTMLT